MKVVCASRGPESTSAPESAVLENPFCPVTEHEIASVVDQSSLVDVSLRTRVGSALREIVGKHCVSDGAATLQEPLHITVPELVWPQTFAPEVHELP